MSVRIGYDKSLKRIHRKLSNNTELHPKALSFFSDVLSVFNDKITVLLVEQCRESSYQEVNTSVLEKLLHRILRPGLATKALQIGRIAVNEYETGNLIYIDKAEQKNAKERQKEIQRGGPFMQGVIDLLHHTDVACTLQCQISIAQIILVICRDILKRSYHGQNELQLCDGEKAVKEIFGPVMSKLASNEGDKAIYYYRKNILIVPKPSSVPDMSKPIRDPLSFVMDEFLLKFVDQIHSEVNRNGRFTEAEVESAARKCLPEPIFRRAMVKAYKDMFLSAIKGKSSRSSSHGKELPVNPTNLLSGSPNSNDSLESGASKKWLCSPFTPFTSSYLQGSSWDSPYRNLQIMISSLIRLPLYKSRICTGSAYVPCITEIQELIETAWREGFDPEGSMQLEGRVYNTRKWIGATEIVTLFSFLGIRTQLIDFHTGTGPEMLRWALQHFTSVEDFKPPIYMQSEGISRTIIGLEQLSDGSLQLIVLDPSCRASPMEQLNNTTANTNAMRLLHVPCSQLNAHRYQLVAVNGICETEQEYEDSKVLHSVRIPSKN